MNRRPQRTCRVNAATSRDIISTGLPFGHFQRDDEKHLVDSVYVLHFTIYTAVCYSLFSSALWMGHTALKLYQNTWKMDVRIQTVKCCFKETGEHEYSFLQHLITHANNLTWKYLNWTAHTFCKTRN